MKKIFSLLAGLMLTAYAASPVMADSLAVSVDVPVQFTFSSTHLGGTVDSSKPSGYKVGLTLPFLLGIGYENYTVATQYVGDTSTLNYKFNFVDLYYTIPLPVVNIDLGLGVGKVAMSDYGYSLSKNAMQYYVSLGFPIFPLFDVHLGYHSVKASGADFTLNGSNQGTADLSGSMVSLGVKFGF